MFDRVKSTFLPLDNNWVVYLAVENKSIFTAISDGFIFIFERNLFFIYYLWKNMFFHLGFSGKSFTVLLHVQDAVFRNMASSAPFRGWGGWGVRDFGISFEMGVADKKSY